MDMNFNRRDLGDGNFLTDSEIAEEFKLDLSFLVGLFHSGKIDGIEGADCWFTTRECVKNFLDEAASVKRSELTPRDAAEVDRFEEWMTESIKVKEVAKSLAVMSEDERARALGWVEYLGGNDSYF